MDGEHGFQCFDFDDDGVFNQQINAVTGVDLDRSVVDRQFELSDYLLASALQLKEQALLISRLQQPWPERGVHLHSPINDLRRDIVDLHRERLFSPRPYSSFFLFASLSSSSLSSCSAFLRALRG
jgi:hypothetical protein